MSSPEHAGREEPVKGILVSIDTIPSSVFFPDQVDVEVQREEGESTPIRLTVRGEALWGQPMPSPERGSRHGEE